MKKGFFVEKSYIKRVYPYLNKNITADTVIVGGGINSAICAYVLAKENVDVVVIEKNIVGFRNTGFSCGCVTDFIDERYSNISSKVDEDILEKCVRLKRKAKEIILEILSEIEIPYYICDSTFLDTRILKRSIKQEANLRREYGEEISCKNDIFKENYINVMRIIDNTIMFDAYEFTQKLFKLLSTKYNVRVYENTCMESVKCTIDGVKVYNQNDFCISAKSLILTSVTNAIDFVTNNPNIEVYRRYSMVSDSINKKEFYAKILNDIPVYIRNTNEYAITSVDLKYMAKMENERFLKISEIENKRKIENMLCRIFQNYEVENSRMYSTNMLVTRDSLPIISEVSMLPNVYINMGSGVSSIIQATIGASILKDAIRGYYPKEMRLFSLVRN